MPDSIASGIFILTTSLADILIIVYRSKFPAEILGSIWLIAAWVVGLIGFVDSFHLRMSARSTGSLVASRATAMPPSLPIAFLLRSRSLSFWSLARLADTAVAPSSPRSFSLRHTKVLSTDYDLYVKQHTDKGHKAINKQRECSAVPNLNEMGFTAGELWTAKRLQAAEQETLTQDGE